MLLFDDEIVEQLAVSAERHAAYSDVELAAFRECEKKLKPAQRELLHERYGLSGPGSTIEQLARRRNESSASIVSALYRHPLDTSRVCPSCHFTGVEDVSELGNNSTTCTICW